MEIHRRELFALLRPRAVAVPAVRVDACTSLRGCRACLPACRRNALTADGGKITVNEKECDGCGCCSQACPRGAFQSDQFTPEMVEKAMLRALSASPGRGAPVVLFHCRLTALNIGQSSSPGHRRSFVAIGLPCLELPVAFLILRALARGAGQVILLPCDQGCRYGFAPGSLDDEVRFVHKVMDLCGLDRARVRVLPGTSVQALEREAERVNDLSLPEIQDDVMPSFPYRSLGVAGLLKSVHPAPDITVTEGAAGCGLARADAETCSLCGLCARACMSRALSLEKRNGQMELVFHHALCNGCGECVAVCDDRALGIDAGLESRWLYEPKVLARSPLARCRLCGKELGPAGVHSTILKTLARHDLRMEDFVTLCSACKFEYHLRRSIAAPAAGECNQASTV